MAALAEDEAKVRVSFSAKAADPAVAAVREDSAVGREVEGPAAEAAGEVAADD